MLGGIVCARRHSEAAPSMKSAVNGFSQNSIPPASTIIPLAGNNTSNDQIILKPYADGIDESTNNAMVYSGELVTIGHGNYEYMDTASSFVGRGSYGIVYKGFHRSTNQTVAIKKMWRINVKPDELAAMKCVRNEHLASLIDIFDETADITYLVMELCDTDLDRHLRFNTADGFLSNQEMTTLVRSIALGYYALFEKHIVHRDIKPQNILLVLNGGKNNSNKTIVSARITDFGVSRVLADDSMALSNVAGTLYYMAPEVGANLVTISEYNAEADMWSIGCLLFQCKTGNVPFDESALCRIFLYCAGENYDAYEVPKLPPGTESDLRDLITSLLEIDCSKRETPRQLYNSISKHETSDKNPEVESKCSHTNTTINGFKNLNVRR